MPAPPHTLAVPPGVYAIGNDQLPEARPRHSRRIDRTYWIDAAPLAVTDFAAFVLAGGYADGRFWPGRRIAPTVSVDDRCDAVRRARAVGENAMAIAAGLTWYEAFALAAFSGGRLAYEIEWEIAATLHAASFERGSGLLEWTADAFAAVYWRSDFARRGRTWAGPDSGEPISVRGHLPGDLVHHVSVRRGLSPDGAALPCGLRRVWDLLPPGAVVLD